MYSQRIRALLDPRKFITTAAGTTVREAVLAMAERNVGAVLVVEGERLVGIFSERDVAFRVVAAGRDPLSTRVAEVMTPDPVVIDAAECYGYALSVMHQHGFRHLPVLDRGRLAGIISARNALDPDLEEFVAESRRREAVSQRSARI